VLICGRVIWSGLVKDAELWKAKAAIYGHLINMCNKGNWRAVKWAT